MAAIKQIKMRQKKENAQLVTRPLSSHKLFGSKQQFEGEICQKMKAKTGKRERGYLTFPHVMRDPYHWRSS